MNFCKKTKESSDHCFLLLIFYSIIYTSLNALAPFREPFFVDCVGFCNMPPSPHTSQAGVQLGIRKEHWLHT